MTYLFFILFFQVAVSTSHIVALTSELLVFTWGDGRRGQLGHGELETWRSRPEAVESLKARISERIKFRRPPQISWPEGCVRLCGYKVTRFSDFPTAIFSSKIAIFKSYIDF